MSQTAGTEVRNAILVDEAVVELRTEQGLLSMLSTRRLLVLIFMLVIFVSTAQPITDPDFWWHLKTGQYIAETRSIPYVDIFSNVRLGAEWVTHEWLSEVLMYVTYLVFGFGGLIVLFSALITTAFWIAYRRMRKYVGNPYFAGFALLLGAAATMPTWGVRPQIISILLTSIFLSLLDGYSRRAERSLPQRAIWWLVPLMILWVNMHAGFVLGLILIALAIIGVFLDALMLQRESLLHAFRRARVLCVVGLMCVAAVCVNPNGLRLYSYPLETMSSNAMMTYIHEWRSPDFHDPMFQALALLILLTFTVIALSPKRCRPSELLLLAATCWATLRSGRNVPFFALVAIPVLAEHSWAWIASYRRSRWSSLGKQSGRGLALRFVVNLVLLIVILALAVAGVDRAVAQQPLTEAQRFPKAAVDFMLVQKPPQPLYNEWVWGGYLIWRLYPQYRVSIDGRADVYGDKLVGAFVAIHDGDSTWRESLDRSGIRTVLIKPGVPLASLLRNDGSWKNVFEDEHSVIFVRN